MQFIVGLVFISGGLVFVKQAIDGARNLFHCALFGILGFATGLLLCYWAVFGPPVG
jgi:hypothetical protein